MRRNIYSTLELSDQNKVVLAIPSGSRGEGLELDKSDFDMMMRIKDIRVYESSNNIDPADKKGYILMDTIDVKKGFTRLRVPMNDANNTEMLFNMGLVVEFNRLNYLSSALVREYGLPKDMTIMVHVKC